jgi:hypothetical protein
MKIKFIGSILIGIVCLLSISEVFSFQVPDLPSGNLVTNPWFRSVDDPDESGLNGWVDAGGMDRYWSSSQKEANPTPDILISGVCGFQATYCGTAARLALTMGQSGGIGIPGVDAYLYQVVPANSSHHKLTFFTHWVSHRIDPASVTIYGGNNANGPWTAVWTPFYHTQDTNPPSPPGGSAALWEQTGFLTKTINNGFSFYKIEIHARLPEGEAVGFKITGVYFSTAQGNSPPPMTPTPVPTPPPSTPNRFIYLPIIISDSQ